MNRDDFIIVFVLVAILSFAGGVYVGNVPTEKERCCELERAVIQSQANICKARLDACYERVENRERRIDEPQHDAVDAVLDEAT